MTLIIIPVIAQNTTEPEKRKKEVYNPGDYVPPSVPDSTLTLIQNAGDELIRFSITSQIGTGLEAAGLGVILYSTFSEDVKQSQKMMRIGFGIAILGLLTQMSGLSEAYKAGSYLKLDQDGIGLKVLIK